jgi:hypothetical protein
VTSNLPTPHEDAPAEATAVTALVLAGFGFPMTAAAAAFAFGRLEDIGKGFLVALVVWVLGIAVSLIQPLRTAPSDGATMPPALRWGLAALAIAALAAVVASSAPLLPWSLTLLVGPFFAWTAGSLWVLSRAKTA